MKTTLLEMTQNILSAMDSDEVNSITDTVESQQVAEEIRNTYYELYSNRDIAQFETLMTLESGNVTNPNTLTLPDNAVAVKWIKYRNWRVTGTKWENIEYLDPEEFISRVIHTDTGNSGVYATVPLITSSPATYVIQANRTPSYFTIFDDDRTLVFDAFDTDYEAFLLGSSALAWGVVTKEFDLIDDFIPDLETNLFPHLLAEAKSACFINIKQVASSKEEQRARRQLIRSQRYLNKTNQKRIIYAPDYARRSSRR